MQKKTFLTSVRAQGDEPSITISTSAPDRDGDVLIPSGCDLANYRKNPIVLFGHDYEALPVGSTTRIDVRADGLVASWQWLSGDDRAQRVRNAYEQGALRAASVGFRPVQSSPRMEGGKLYSKWELLEWSLVPVPANPEAVRMLKAMGLGNGGDVVLDLDDDVLELDEHLDFDDRDLAAAVADVFTELKLGWRETLGPVIQHETRRALAQARGRLSDDPLPLDRVRRRSEGMPQGDDACVRAIMRDVIKDTVGTALRDIVAREVGRGIARTRV
jgi:HK97 family phage prohead protease